MSYDNQLPNPYDQNTQDLTPETKPLDEILRIAIATALMKMRVHLPGKIVAIKGNQKVDIQPLLQTRYQNGDVVTLPVIQNVMVGMPMGDGYSIKLPIAVGDTGHILFCDRSLDIWANSSGGVVDPQDSRIHDISDPIFIPGLVPFSQQTTDATTDLVVTNGTAQMKVQKAGTFEFTNGSNELIDLIDQLMDTLINDTFTNTMLGPQPFIGFTINKLTDIRTKLDTLKGD